MISIMPNPAAIRPETTEHAPDFGKYIHLVPDSDILLFLAAQQKELLGLLTGLSEKDSLIKHAPYTWTIKQVLGHITDCERVFGHRALWIARNNTTPLSGFDETDFMNAVNFDRYPMPELVAEFENVRQSHLLLFRHLDPEAWLRRGTVWDRPATVRVFPWAIAGHTKHHLDILHKRLGR
jgi:DinB superfamily